MKEIEHDLAVEYKAEVWRIGVMIALYACNERGTSHENRSFIGHPW